MNFRKKTRKKYYGNALKGTLLKSRKFNLRLYSRDSFLSRRRNGNAFTYFKVKAGDFDLFQVESHVYASKSVGQSLDKMVTTLLISYSFTNAKTCHVTTNKFNFASTKYFTVIQV